MLSGRRSSREIISWRRNVTGIIELLDEIIRKLTRGESLPDENRDHPLSGNWNGFRECHIQSDWLLVYRIDDDVLVLTLARTGTHSDLRF